MKKRKDRRWRMVRCLRCGKQCERYCTATKCPCGGDFVPVEQEAKCPTCGRPYNSNGATKRFCAKCKKQIVRGHKWSTVQIRGLTTMVHRNCADPRSYGPR